MRVLFVLGLLVVVVGCGGGGDATCHFNSDCASGRYCAPGGRCTADCASDAECVPRAGAGAVCTSFGMCVGPGDAGSMPDAGPSTRDAGTDVGTLVTPDAGSDAGNDASSCGAEVCTVSTGGARVADEDCDGSFDEGCTWSFGRPHWLTQPLVDGNALHYSAGISADGLRLYFSACGASWTNCQPNVVERTSAAQRFGAPTVVPGTWPTGFYVLTIASDELEAYAEVGTASAGSDIYRATRSRTDVAFDPPMPVTVLNSSGHDRVPTLAPGDLEMFFSREFQMMRSTRPTRTDAWSTPVPIALGTMAEVDGPTLSRDGRTMFFYGRDVAASPRRIYRAERATATSTTFGMPVVVAELESVGSSAFENPVFSESTRELFYFATGGWTAASGALWRAQVCRDGPCLEATVPCPASGVRSPDGFHCYVLSTSPAAWDQADATCAGAGTHLVTLHSAPELVLVAGLGSANYQYVALTDAAREGTWRWAAPSLTFPEAVTQAVWQAGEPNGGVGENCAVLWQDHGDRFGDVPCANASDFVCEGELWPTW